MGGRDERVALKLSPSAAPSVVPAVIAFAAGAAFVGAGTTGAILVRDASPSRTTALRAVEIAGFALGGAAIVVTGVVLLVVRPSPRGMPSTHASGPGAAASRRRRTRVGEHRREFLSPAESRVRRHVTHISLAARSPGFLRFARLHGCSSPRAKGLARGSRCGGPLRGRLRQPTCHPQAARAGAPHLPAHGRHPLATLPVRPPARPGRRGPGARGVGGDRQRRRRRARLPRGRARAGPRRSGAAPGRRRLLPGRARLQLLLGRGRGPLPERHRAATRSIIANHEFDRGANNLGIQLQRVGQLPGPLRPTTSSRIPPRRAPPRSAPSSSRSPSSISRASRWASSAWATCPA